MDKCFTNNKKIEIYCSTSTYINTQQIVPQSHPQHISYERQQLNPQHISLSQSLSEVHLVPFANVWSVSKRSCVFNYNANDDYQFRTDKVERRLPWSKMFSKTGSKPVASHRQNVDIVSFLSWTWSRVFFSYLI